MAHSSLNNSGFVSLYTITIIFNILACHVKYKLADLEQAAM